MTTTVILNNSQFLESESPVYQTDLYAVYILTASHEIPEYAATIGWRAAFYAVVNRETCVIEHETSYLPEAKMFAYTATRALMSSPETEMAKWAGSGSEPPLLFEIGGPTDGKPN